MKHGHFFCIRRDPRRIRYRHHQEENCHQQNMNPKASYNQTDTKRTVFVPQMTDHFNWHSCESSESKGMSQCPRERILLPTWWFCFPLKPEDTCTPNRIKWQEIKTVDTLYKVRKRSAWNIRRTYHDNISSFSLISPGFNQSLSIVCRVHLISAPMERIWLRNHNWAVCPKT